MFILRWQERGEVEIICGEFSALTKKAFSVMLTAKWVCSAASGGLLDQQKKGEGRSPTKPAKPKQSPGNVRPAGKLQALRAAFASSGLHK
jgi:hypothetical protein